MADRDRAAVGVQAIHRHAEPIAAVDDLRRERFVQLPHVDVVHLQPVLLQQLRHGEDRTDAHLVRLAAGDRVAAEHEQRLQAERLRAIARHHERGRRAVRQLRRVAGRDAARAARGVEDRRQLLQAFERGVGAVALVALDARVLLADLLAGLLVEDGARAPRSARSRRRRTRPAARAPRAAG